MPARAGTPAKVETPASFGILARSTVTERTQTSTGKPVS
jgi:hypothetical protein